MLKWMSTRIREDKNVKWVECGIVVLSICVATLKFIALIFGFFLLYTSCVYGLFLPGYYNSLFIKKKINTIGKAVLVPSLIITFLRQINLCYAQFVLLSFLRKGECSGVRGARTYLHAPNSFSCHVEWISFYFTTRSFACVL